MGYKIHLLKQGMFYFLKTLDFCNKKPKKPNTILQTNKKFSIKQFPCCFLYTRVNAIIPQPVQKM